MNILLVEDNYHASKIQNSFINSVYNLERAKTIREAVRSLESGKPYQAAIVDLDLDREYLFAHLSEEIMEAEAEQYGGWVFYRHILRNYPPLDKNTIILSALIRQFIDYTDSEQYEGMYLINKSDMNCESKVFKALHSLIS